MTSRTDLLPVPTTAELDRLFASMPGREASRVIAFKNALVVFGAAKDKAAAARAMAARLAPLGYAGLSLKSLYRKLATYRAEGIWGLVPPKYKKENTAGIAANAAFVEYWQTLCLENRRKVRPAWRRLLRDFAAGADIPGIGTWREMYLEEHGYLPAQGEPCPWSTHNPPPGWSLRNLSQFAPDSFSLLAARRGMAAAKSAFGLTVRKTRVGLPCCRLVEVDDMWYEQAVMYEGNREPQRVVEFAAVDVLTGHVVCHLAKPIRERADGTKETLRSAWAKYVYHYVLCVSGIPPEGCTILGERGTARSDAEFEAALLTVNEYRKAAGLGPVEFKAGALLNAPLAKGLHDGAPKGNPRNKPHVEQMHATLKNELGHILGEIGGGRGLQPEETAAMAKEASRLALVARAAGLPAESLKTPFLSWTDFSCCIEEAHRNIDMRTDHDLEGWAECGFLGGEFRLKAEASWRSVPRLSDMSPAEAGAITALAEAGIAEYRERRLSPREAWAKSKSILQPLPESLSPAILGSELAATARVNANMQLCYKDPNIGVKLTVAAVAGGHLLVRGREYRVWVNPLDGGKAHVCDIEGHYLGTATVLQAVRADASPEELAAQLGQRQKILAAEARRLAPIAAKRLREANARAAHNLSALGIEDPVAAAERQAAADLAASKGGRVEVDDLVAAPPGAAPDLDELL